MAKHDRSLTDVSALHFCRVGPAGLSPVAPGTAGSAVAAVAAPWVFQPLPMWGRVAALIVIFAAGGLAASRVERLTGKKDPGQVVIDEVLGQWITYLPFAVLSWWMLAAGFFLFRFFDIVKPWPVRASEKWLPGGFGVMIDDALAGVYAMACLAVMLQFIS